jgi:hypothetical protein
VVVADPGPAAARTRTESVVLDGPAGPLEAVIDEPAATRDGAAFGVICHPHSLFGGSLTNKVVHTVARGLNDSGIPTLRFNFRGVGASAGVYDEGRGESEDLLAAIRHGRARWPDRALWLGGFSFGAYVALRTQSMPVAAPSRLLLVAPPLGRWDFSALLPPACPWLVVQGMRDELVDGRAVQSWSAALPRPPQFVAIEQAEHFFHGRLAELRDAVRQFARAPG